MSDRTTVGLDNQFLQGNLRQPMRPAQVSLSRMKSSYVPRRNRSIRNDINQPVRRAAPVARTAPPPLIADITQATAQSAMPAAPAVPAKPKTAPIPIQRAQPYARPAAPRQQRSEVLWRPVASSEPKAKANPRRRPFLPNMSRLQLGLSAMAVVVFTVGLLVSWQTLRTNHNAAAQVAALTHSATAAAAPATPDTQAATTTTTVPSTVKPTTHAVSVYTVGPTMPRYLNIPTLKVHARILSLGILASGALATPNNVFDTGWYNESALPGQPGAMLIDGHVSSWTTAGVFYGLKNLKAGDALQVVRGDGTAFNYQVVTSKVFSDGNVDMQSAVTPITPGKPGLNLITCDGQVKPGTSEFNERIIVYAQQI